MNEQDEKNEINTEENNTVYKTSTPRGSIFNLLSASTSSVITLKEDNMEIFIYPKRLNKIPNIRYEDIEAVELKKCFSWYYAILGILFCLSVIMPLISIWLGRFRKIKITLKNGMTTDLYCAASKTTEMLYADIKNRIAAANNKPLLNSQ